MQKSVFNISKMDCPSEENLIRMKLDVFKNIKHLAFKLNKRELVVYHDNEVDFISKALQELNLGSKLITSNYTDKTAFTENKNQKKVLWIVLLINFSFFIIESVTGLISKSMGLFADSLDMLADSFVYGLSLYAVGSTVIRKKKVAKYAGYFQIILAIIGFIEVIRRFISSENLPNYNTIIIVAILALIANAICLILIQKNKSKEEAHMKASLIFTSNDIIINVGVICSGFLVHFLNSNKPDLIIGFIVFIVVLLGAGRILKISK